VSEAAGTHLLDFETFAARANAVFFVSPGQLHAWAARTAGRHAGQRSPQRRPGRGTGL